MRGTPWIKRVYSLGLKAVPNFTVLPPEVVAYYEGHLDEIPAALVRGFILPKPLSISFATTFGLAAVKGKKTSKCFEKGPRDGNIDGWLNADQPDSDPCTVTTVGFSREWTNVEIAKLVTGLNTVNMVVLGNKLIKCGVTLTLTQVEAMTQIIEWNGTRAGTHRTTTFFFIETSSRHEPVAIGRVSRDEEFGWTLCVCDLGLGNRWSAHNRFLLRNVDSSKLGL